MESASVGESFRTSSYSDNGGGNCVELGQAPAPAPGVVLVRDTKDRTRGSLAFPRRTWTNFTSRLRRGI
ncbi:MAG: DUF397 domain-containing protein [Streptosporangiales bacterium]|nr:DUF397 domain-containing protein [Streptosporangiales bacterium]